MKERLFKFKKFSVRHERSAMKVGVDGVLIGAWAKAEGTRILDVGTGCGLIALMMAQRNENALIDAVEIDCDSALEAQENISASPWKNRISVYNKSFEEYIESLSGTSYDLIVSNPPFFDSGVINPATPRETARHQHGLSPKTLLENGVNYLKEEGRISLIVPFQYAESLIEIGNKLDLCLSRSCSVRDNVSVKEKRILLEFVNDPSQCLSDKNETVSLTMFGTSGEPTNEYRMLCKDFYLRF